MMDEEMEQFEKDLSRLPLRPVPTEWRAEILASAADVNRRQEVSPEFTFAATFRSWLSTLNSQLSTIFWPRPAAWAVLAAVWIFIGALDFSVRDHTPVVAQESAPPSPEMRAELRQQQRLLAELIGARDTREAETPKYPLRPRSERVEIRTL